MKIFFSFFTLISSVFLLSAQNPTQDLVKYSAEYPDENFIILEKTTKTIIDVVDGELEVREEVFEEHFFLTSDAAYMADHSISYSSFFSGIESISASSLIPNKNKYKKLKVEKFTEQDELSGSIFHDDVKSTNFIFPSVQKGAKTVLSYTKKLNEPRFLGGEYFISYAPVLKQEFIIETAPDVELGISSFNLEGSSVKFTKTEERNKVVYRWSSDKATKPKFESNAPHISYYSPHVVPFIKSYSANGKKKNLLRNVDDLFDWYNSFMKEVNLKKDNEEMRALVDSLVAGAKDDLEKVKRVFYWTQDNIKYVAFEDGLGGFIPRQADAVIEKRYGDCKDMASCITKMLDYADVPAYITWIGSDDIPYKYAEVPTPVADNHMIAAYEHEGKFYFLDATGQYTPFGMPTGFIQGKEGLVRTSENEYKIVEVPVVAAAVNSFVDSVKLKIDGSELVGNAVTKLGGYYKINVTYRVNSKTNREKEKYYKSYLAKGNNKFLIKDSSLTEENLTDRDQPLRVSYDFGIRDYVRQNDDEIYVNLNLINWFQGDDKIEEDRIAPFRYKFKSTQLLYAELEIPEGYEVTYLPESVVLTEDLFTFKNTYSVEGNKVVLQQEGLLDFIQLKKENFASWNKFLKDINDARFQSIVFTKK